MRIEDLDFQLPPELIAQAPAADRAGSRLMRYRRTDGSLSHQRFSDLPGLLLRGDLLVFNDTRVLPARFGLLKGTGGKVEGLFLVCESPGRWNVLLKDAGKNVVGTILRMERDPRIAVRVEQSLGQGKYRLAVESSEPPESILGRVGRMPLPPYIQRARAADPADELDRQRYQTVYARAPGSVAAPTAGLHFTSQMLAELDAAGVEHAFVTLHVGLGTFKPITAATLEGHAMHAETYEIGPAAAEAVNRAQRDGRRIVAVGTTSARVLESQEEGPITARRGETSIFIYPPYRWKRVGGLVTNFHLPRSTLIALVAAMVGVPEQQRIYHTAIEQRYRFFSYGDAMLIE